MTNQHTSQRTPDDTLAQWYEDVKAGRKTYAQLAAENGLSRDAIKGRVEKWRVRVGHVQGAERPPQDIPPSEPDGEVLYLDLKVRSDEGDFAAKYLDTIIDLQKLEATQDNEQDVAHVEIKDNRPVMPVFSGDWHIGNRYTDHLALREHLRLIRETPGVYMVGMGDYDEQFVGRRAGVGIHEHCIKPKQQRAVARHLFKDELGTENLLAALAGNHCWKPEELTGEDPVADVCAELGVPYLGFGGILHVRLCEAEYKGGVWHSYPGGSAINPGNNQRRVRNDHDALDFVCLGHLHYSYVQEASNREGRDYIDLRSGSFKVRDPRYAAQKVGAKGGDPRMPGLILWPQLSNGRKRMMYFRDFKDGLDYLAYLRGE